MASYQENLECARKKTEIFYIGKCDVGAAKMRLSILCVAIIFTFSYYRSLHFRLLYDIIVAVLWRCTQVAEGSALEMR